MTYPQRLTECIQKLKVLDVNKATLHTYKAENKEAIIDNMHLIFRNDAFPVLMESLIAFSLGQTYFDGYGVNYDLEGNKLIFRISWSLPDAEPDNLKNVVVVKQDYTRMEKFRTELEESESLFRNVFEQSSEGLMLFDETGKITLVNLSFSKILGLSQSNLVGKTIWKVYADFAKDKDLDKGYPFSPKDIQSILEHPETEPHVFEYSFRDKRSKYQAHKLTFQPVQVNTQRVYSLMLSDLSAYYRSELVSAMLHQISHAVNTEVSLDELFQIIHKSMERLVNVENFYIALYDSKSRLITFPYIIDQFDEDNSPISIDFADSLTAQIINGAQTLLLDETEVQQRSGLQSGGHRLAKNYLGTPLILSGNVIGVLAVQSYIHNNLYDIEDKRFLESVSEQIAFALHKKQRDSDITVLIQAIEQAGEGIAIFTAQGFIYYVNTVFERSIGYQRTELLDRPYEALPFEPESLTKMHDIWTRVRSSQPWRGKMVMINKNGSKVTLDMVVKPVLDLDSQVSSIIASCKDVTFEILREEQLKRTQRLEAVGRLTSGIAHDFNNILSAVIGYTELAAADIGQESDGAEKLVEVLKSAYRTKEMIAHLISFSRQEEARTEIIDLVEHVKESVRFLASYLPGNIEIVQNYEASRGTITAVPSQIQQIIVNLGTNAMHAIGQKQGRLEFSASFVTFHSKDMIAFPELDQCEYIRICVKDSGCGIEENKLQQIFDPYFTTKQTAEGTGLGLSIVHNIVLSHRGAIRVESEIGKGTEFQVYLPVYKSETATTRMSLVDRAKDEPDEVTGVETILFVDDEPMLVSVFKQGLMRLGFNVEGHTDPRKALEFFDKHHHHIDIVLTNTTMPHMNGLELAEKMLDISPRMPIILCTGFTTLVTAEEAKQRGIRDFVMKPFKIKEIAHLIREILDEGKKESDAHRLAPE